MKPTPLNLNCSPRRSDLLQLITVRLMGTAHKPSSTASTASVSQSQPLAGAGPTAVTAEQLALQLGQSRVQLGVNLPAHRLTQRAAEQGPGQGPGSGAEEVVLYFGIIDILQVRGNSAEVTLGMKPRARDWFVCASRTLGVQVVQGKHRRKGGGRGT